LKEKIKHPDINTRIKSLIIENLSLEIEPGDIDDDQSLIAGTLGLDSVLTMELTISLEEEFGISIPDEELSEEMFDSVASLADYVRLRLDSTKSLYSG
jgi:acyl carrier protein